MADSNNLINISSVALASVSTSMMMTTSKRILDTIDWRRDTKRASSAGRDVKCMMSCTMKLYDSQGKNTICVTGMGSMHTITPRLNANPVVTKCVGMQCDGMNVKMDA